MLYKYKPKTKKELIEAIKKEINEVQGSENNPNWHADLNCIDTSLITDMSYLFSNKYDLKEFNGNISKWNISNVRNMEGMFLDSKFNGDISKWNTKNVKNMSSMFYKSKFNQDISKWNVSNVKNMSYMFEKSQFNGDISKWNVSNVTDMSRIFSDSQFNGDISKWDVSNVEDMEGMFLGSKFNGDISKWNVSNVKDMKWMFAHSKINQNISNWNISNVKNMEGMFLDSKFNGDIGSWPLKETTGLENISISFEYNKFPNKIVFSVTIANIFIRSINYSDEIFNIDNFKQIFKNFLNNRKKIYKSKGYKPEIIKKLILNDIANILKHIKDKNMQNKFIEIMAEKNSKEPDIDIVS